MYLETGGLTHQFANVLIVKKAHGVNYMIREFRREPNWEEAVGPLLNRQSQNLVLEEDGGNVYQGSEKTDLTGMCL